MTEIVRKATIRKTGFNLSDMLRFVGNSVRIYENTGRIFVLMSKIAQN